MSKIKNIKVNKKKEIILTLVLDYKEYKLLSGKINDIIVFPEENLIFDTRLIKRGRRESSKYLLLPKKIRENLNPCQFVTCNKIEKEDRFILIFSIPKININFDKK